MSQRKIWTPESEPRPRQDRSAGLEHYKNLMTKAIPALRFLTVEESLFDGEFTGSPFKEVVADLIGRRDQTQMAKEGTSEPERRTQLLRDVVISRIEPSSVSQHPKLLYPSVYDILTMDLFVPVLLLYRLESTDPSAFSNFVHSVKNSLSQVLSFYYPMAGKWIVAEDAWTRKLVCNDEGVVFVEAAVDYEMDNLLDRDNLSSPEELTGDHAVPGFDAASVYKTSETKDYPSLIVQVTRLKCGGVAVVLNYNHMTLDGFGFDRFVKAWSEILSTGQTSVKPVFDRSMLVTHLDKSQLLGVSPDMENLDDSLSSYFKPFIPQVERNDFTSKLFSIRKDVVARLRQKAKEEHVSDILERPERFTTFECVSAQLWRCFARIPKFLGITIGEDMVQIACPVEGRRKWINPPLPEDYVGNVILGAGLPQLPSPEVTDKPFSFAASRIHESVMKINHKTSGQVLDWTLEMMTEMRLTREKLKTEKPDNHNRAFPFTITSWSRFDNFYNLDFGCGGPFRFSPCPVWKSSDRGTAFILPPAPKSGNAVEMVIHAPPEYFSILLEDPEFVDLVSFVMSKTTA